MQPDEISVRQARDLLTPFSRFHLTMDTLGVRLYPSRYRAGSGLSPVRTCAHRAHNKSGAHTGAPLYPVDFSITIICIEYRM